MSQSSAPEQQNSSKGKAPAAVSIGIAGVTCVLVVNVIHPIDTIKTRIQVDPAFTFRGFFKQNGVLGLWKGIQPAWVREAVYSSIKLGGYAPIKELIGGDRNFFLKFAAGSLSGAIGSVFGNPFDVLKTKMQAGGGADGTVSLARQLYHEQGAAGFARGLQASVARAAVLTGTKMACYDGIKGLIVDKTGLSRKDLRVQFAAAVGAGFFMTCTVTPFDMLRTTLMNQPTDKKVYSGMIDCAKKVVAKDGMGALYKGFFPIWARFAPAATLQLVVMEALLHQAGYDAI